MDAVGQISPPQVLGRRLVVLVGVTAFFNIVALMASSVVLLRLGRLPGQMSLDAPELASAYLWQELTGNLHMMMGVTSFVGLLIWIYQANRYLRQTGVPGLQYSPGWVVAGFFIPFVCLVMPYRVVKEIWQASDPDTTGEEWRRVPSGLVALWWATWLISGTLGFIAWQSGTEATTVAQALPAYRLNLFLDISSICEYAMRLVLLLHLNSRLQARHEAWLSRRQAAPAGQEPAPAGMSADAHSLQS